MINPNQTEHFQDKVSKYMRTDFPRLNDTLTVEITLNIIRQEGIGERIIYFYVLDEDEKLIGIVPTRRLLTSMPDVHIDDLMVTELITISHHTTVLEAAGMFVKHKLLAFPVLDDEERMIGVIDAGLFSEEEMSFAASHRFDDLFQMIGFGLKQIKGKTAIGIFRYRFP